MQPRLRSIAIAAGVAIPLGSLVGAIVSVVPGGNFDVVSVYLVLVGAFFLQGMLFAIPVALLYGVPLHYLLSRNGWANYLTSILFGAVPSIVIFLFGDIAWTFALYYGVPIAVIYHAVISILSSKTDKSSPPNHVPSG